MSGTCQYCEHWLSFANWFKENEEWNWDSFEEFLENRTKHSDDWQLKQWGECRIGRTSGGRLQERTLAAGFDEEQYHAYLKTSPDYGCNQFAGLGE